MGEHTDGAGQSTRPRRAWSWTDLLERGDRIIYIVVGVGFLAGGLAKFHAPGFGFPFQSTEFTIGSGQSFAVTCVEVVAAFGAL